MATQPGGPGEFTHSCYKIHPSADMGTDTLSSHHEATASRGFTAAAGPGSMGSD